MWVKIRCKYPGLVGHFWVQFNTRQPVRQLTPWMACSRATQEQLPRVISFPIPLRILFASQPQLLSPVLKVIHRAISTLLIKQAGLKVSEAKSGAVTLLTMEGLMQRSTGRARAAIQRFGSAANLNIHLHCLFLDGVYRQVDGKTVFQTIPPPKVEQLQQLLQQLIQRLMKCLVRQGALTEDEGQLSLNTLDDDMDPSLAPLQAAACTYRIALGPRSGLALLSPSMASQHKHIRVQKSSGLANRSTPGMAHAQ